MTGTDTIRFHPVANLFPLLAGEAFAELVESIRNNGLREPIWTHPEDGSIVDGRNRYKACIEAGVEPRFREWNGQGSLIQFVVDLNIKRRHLSAGQVACVALDSLPMLEEEARQRQATSTGGTEPQLVELVPQADGAGKSRDKAAVLFSVNPHYITDAKKLRRDKPDVFDEVRFGKKSLKAAMAEVKEEEQARKEREWLESLPDRVETFKKDHFRPIEEWPKEPPAGTDLEGRDPNDFIAATHVGGILATARRDLQAEDLSAAVRGAFDIEVEAWRADMVALRAQIDQLSLLLEGKCQ